MIPLGDTGIYWQYSTAIDSADLVECSKIRSKSHASRLLGIKRNNPYPYYLRRNPSGVGAPLTTLLLPAGARYLQDLHKSASPNEELVAGLAIFIPRTFLYPYYTDFELSHKTVREYSFDPQAVGNTPEVSISKFGNSYRLCNIGVIGAISEVIDLPKVIDLDSSDQVPFSERHACSYDPPNLDRLSPEEQKAFIAEIVEKSKITPRQAVFLLDVVGHELSTGEAASKYRIKPTTVSSYKSKVFHKITSARLRYPDLQARVDAHFS